MGRTKAARMTVWLAAAALACGGGRDEPSPEPEAGPEGPPEAVAPTLSPDGYGEIRIGMTLGEAVQILGESPDPIGEPACAYLDPDVLPEGVMLMVVQDTLVRIDVMEAGVETAAGIGIASTEAEVASAYGEVERMPHKYTDGRYLIVRSADGARSIVFETDGEAVTSFRAGRMPEVQWVEGCA